MLTFRPVTEMSSTPLGQRQANGALRLWVTHKIHSDRTNSEKVKREQPSVVVYVVKSLGPKALLDTLIDPLPLFVLRFGRVRTNQTRRDFKVWMVLTTGGQDASR